MKHLCLMLMICASPALAQDFSAGSEARSWNLFSERPARFEAKVVDVLCEITGECAQQCGNGQRQLGLLRTSDDVLVLTIKNGQPAFSGAAEDLAPFCNEIVEVDGLLLEDDYFPIKNLFLVQRIKHGDADWVKANTWTKKWAEANPAAAGKGPWFRRDPRIKEIIGREGYFGIGLEADQVYAEENF